MKAADQFQKATFLLVEALALSDAIIEEIENSTCKELKILLPFFKDKFTGITNQLYHNLNQNNGSD